MAIHHQLTERGLRLLAQSGVFIAGPSQDFQMENLSFFFEESEQFLMRLKRSDSIFDAIVTLFAEAIALMPDIPYSRAVENALGLGEITDKQLGNRRKTFCETHQISERTLVRHERKGETMLIEYLDKVLAMPLEMYGTNDVVHNLHSEIQALKLEIEGLKAELAKGSTTDG